MTMVKPRRLAMNSTGMFILTVLISLAIVAQNGWAVSAIENPSATLDAAAIRAIYVKGRSKENSKRHSSLRRLQDPTTTTPPPPSDEEVLAESAEILAEAVEEKNEDETAVDPDDLDALNESVAELAQAVEELEEVQEELDEDQEEEGNLSATTEATAVGTTDFVDGFDEAAVEAVFVGDNSTAETTYPGDESYEEESAVETTTNSTEYAGVNTTEAAEDSEIGTFSTEQPLPGISTEVPAPGDDVDNDLVDDPNLPTFPGDPNDIMYDPNLPPLPGVPTDIVGTTPSPSSIGSQDELSNGEDEDEEGEPLIFESTLSPSAAADGNGEGDVKAPVPTPYPTTEDGVETAYPTNGEENWDWGGDSPWGSTPQNPTESPTPRPTSRYVPKESGDPLVEEVEPDVVDFKDDDEVFYHGLGGKVGSYLDGVESPQDMEKDKNVQIVAGTLVASFIVAMLIAAHLVMQYPDGLCAGCCRLTLKVICCFTRTLCLPCRAICCKSSDQAQGRRTHAPMRTPFPTDLELA